MYLCIEIIVASCWCILRRNSIHRMPCDYREHQVIGISDAPKFFSNNIIRDALRIICLLKLKLLFDHEVEYSATFG